MDRNRFKTKPSEGVVAPRPAARPVHHAVRPLVAGTPPAHSVKPPAPQHAPQPVQPVAQAPSQRPNKLSRRRITEIALGIAVLIGVGGFILGHSDTGKADLQGATANASSGLHVTTNGAAANNSSATVSGTVPFTPVVPKDKPQLAKLGSAAYNAQYKSYSFDDTFNGQKIRVSEQELPSGQTSAAGLIDKISASLKPQSVQPFTPANGQAAYLLNATTQAGAQVVIFTAKDLLFFVQSSVTHDAAVWTDYINNFQ